MNRLLSAIDWLLPEEAHADLESRIQARVLVVLMLLAGALSAGVGSLRLVIGSDAGVGVIGVVCGLLLVPLLWAYRRTGVTGRVGDVLVFLALAAIFGSAWLEGGTAAPSVIWFAAVPLWAAFLGGRVTTVPAALLSVGAVATLQVAQGLGLAPDPIPSDEATVGHLASTMGLVLYMGAGGWLIERSRRQLLVERERLDRLRRDWVSVVNHELRTPLTALRGSLGLLGSGVVGPMSDTAVELAEMAARSAERLHLLVDDILDMQKIESGKLKVRAESFACGAILEDVWSEFEAMALASGVTVVVQPSDLWVEGDPRRSRQVLTNFVSNALKFSPSGSTLSLGVTRADAEVRFEVSDQGPGIPESFRPQVFEPFAQAESAADRSVGGTGLGLAICRAMVEAQGGEIGFDCAPGGGTTFWFTLAAVESAVVPPS